MLEFWVLIITSFVSILPGFVDSADVIVYTCPSGWRNIGTSCVHVFGTLPDDTRTWENAERECQGNGGQLVSIDDKLTSRQIGDFARDSGASMFWIGMNRKYVPDSNMDKAEWEGGRDTSVYQGNWNIKSPDITDGDCVYIKNVNNDYMWQFAKCKSKMAYICERPSCPSGNFFCHNGRCVSLGAICDTQDDCGDFSDEANCPSNCRNRTMMASGTIMSTQSVVIGNTGNYDNSKVCVWTIIGPVGSNIFLNFTRFNTEHRRDIVDILVGGETEATSTSIARLSGNPNLDTLQFRSPNNFMIVHFSTDASVTKPGFVANYRSDGPGQASSVSLVATDVAQQLIPPRYSLRGQLTYLGSQDYVWIITAQKIRKIITLERVNLDLYKGDTVEIHNGDTPEGGLLAMYTYENNDNFMPTTMMNKPHTGPRFVFSTGNKMYIIMRTAMTMSGVGFQFSYRQGCDVQLNGNTGEVFSPGYLYGINYANFASCSWKISVPNNNRATLIFSDGFDFESQKDFIKVYTDSLDESGTEEHTGSGFTPSTLASKKILHANNGQMFVMFTTNSIGNRKGFYAVYSVDCPNPGFNANTIISGPQTWRYRDTITVSCHTGYYFGIYQSSISSVSMECLFGGKWNISRIPECKPRYCGVPPLVQNAFPNSNGMTLTYNNYVTYQCYPGYRMTGSANITCQSSGSWTSTPSCSIATCNTPPDITNGQKTFTQGDGQEYSSVVRYTCNDGYNLIGAPIAICQSNGQYSNPAPVCRKKKCVLPHIKNGALSPSSIAEYNDVVTVTCNTGYELSQGGTSTTITCTANKTFDTVPQCVNINECNGAHGCQHSCHDNDGSFTCSCNSSYSLQVDGKSCADQNECEPNNGKGPCDQKCNNIPGGYYCSCDVAGYTLYDQNGTSSYYLANSENGLLEGDIYRINHTCVRVECSSPPTVPNSQIMSLREHHRYGDIVEYFCKLGYVINNGGVFKCESNGQWSSSNWPTCSVAQCPPDQLSGLTNTPVVSPAVAVNYLEIVNLTCNVNGRSPPEFIKQRQCLYDIENDVYRLFGAEYECGVISCGDPGIEPGANYARPASYNYASQFSFTCSSLYTVQGNSSRGDRIVRCDADGYWDFGNMQCVGKTCPDPGYPAGGRLIATSFEENSVVTFACDRAGFALDLPDGGARICQLNQFGTDLEWNITTQPNCIDVQKPSAFGFNCGKTYTLNPYTVLSSTGQFSQPLYSDNTLAIETLTVTPFDANTTLALTGTTTVTYTVTDHGGNSDTCTYTVNVADIEPPEVTCPYYPPQEVEMESDTRNPITVTTGVVHNDNSGSSSISSVNPQVITPRGDALGTTLVTVQVADPSGNTDTCRLQVTTVAAPCSPLSLKDPLHGKKNCSSTASGYVCDITCDPTYVILETGQTSQQLTCTQGVAWSQRVPACTKVDTTAEFIQRYEIDYFINGGGRIPEGCWDTNYGKQLSNGQLSQTINGFNTACVNTPGNFIMTIPFSRITHKFTDVSASINMLTVSYEVVITPRDLQSPSYTACAGFIKSNMMFNTFSIFTLLGNLSCPALKGNWSEPSNFETDKQGFLCASFQKKTVIQGTEYCLECPEGMYSSGPGTCDLCPMGKYKNATGKNECNFCPIGKTTRYTGSASLSDCTDLCPSGFYSDDGLPPCRECPRNTFAFNTTYCEPCPDGTITLQTATLSSSQCYAKCPPGTFNYNGYGPNCLQCPENYYQSLEGQTGCQKCPVSQTSPRESISRDNCTDAGPVKCVTNLCQNGGTCEIRFHDAYCVCQTGYWGIFCQNRVLSCSSSPCYNNGVCNDTLVGSFTCDCPAGTTGARCEVDIDDECTSSPCQNGGMCVNQIQGYRCLCKPGFGGLTCDSPTDVCITEPCQNNGQCINIGNVRRKCVCAVGFTGQDCSENIDDCAQNPCQHGGNCTDLVNRYTCNCLPNYTGNRCQTRIDPCNLGSCLGVCVDDYRDDIHRCLCNDGYQYQDRYNNPVCHFGLQRNTKGTGVTPIVSTVNSVADCMASCGIGCVAFAYASGTNTCERYTSEPTMSADASFSYYGKQCVQPEDDYWTPWYNIDDPVSGDNERRSILMSQYGVDVCNGTVPVDVQCRTADTKLPHDTQGDTFSQSCGVDGLECSSSLSNPCSDYEVRYKCGVHRVYQGGTCLAPNRCSPDPCQHGSTCTRQNTDFTCNCGLTGYTGSLCQHNIDNCQQNNCQNGATCVDRVNFYECSCPPGYTGALCDTDIPDCTPTSCNGRGSCIEGVNSFTCSCSPGYTGDDCSIDIDECESEPCMHNGTCTTSPSIVNSYSCQCPVGYTGNQCQTIIDNCLTAQCQSSSTCINLFGGSFCKCLPLTYGDRCQNAPNLCSDIQPCLNQGTCNYVQGQQPTCSCNDNYNGNGCEQKVDHCSDANRCKNGGTCVTLANVGFRCDCVPGYTGPECETNIDDCAGIVCPNQARCIDMLNSFYCRCPVDRTGEDCSRAIDTDYDIFFYAPERNGYATLPYPLYLEEAQFSVTLWVKFCAKDQSGTFLTVFISKTSNRLEEAKPFFALSSSGISVYNTNGQEFMAGYNYTQPNDGRWHSMVVVWDNFRGWSVYMDYVEQARLTDPYRGYSPFDYLWVTLGSKYDFTTMMPVKNEGFCGHLSQFNMYNRRLNHGTEMVQLFDNPRSVFPNHTAAWTDFILHRGVQPTYPSYASRNGQSVVRDKVPPVVNFCPPNQHILTSERLTEVTWTVPQFDGATLTFSNYRPGETYEQGKFLVTYEARDDNQNSAFCHFAVYVNNDNCTNYRGPINGSIDCESQYYPYQGCRLSCPANKKIDRYTPNINTCGPTGNWLPFQRNTPKVFPPCGDVRRQARKKLFVRIVYPNNPPQSCQAIKDAFQDLFLIELKKINTAWSGDMCNSNDCSDIILVVTCGTVQAGRRKRDAHLTSVQITAPSTEPVWTHSQTGEQLSGVDVLTREFLETNNFNFSQVPGSAIDPNELTIDVDDACEDGETVIDGSCVLCGPGTFFNSTTRICDFCQVAEYQESDGAFSCDKCAPGKTTETIGTWSGMDCKDVCQVGSYYSTSMNGCQLCPVGYYQNLTGQFSCKGCPNGQTTRETGSNSSSACYDFCASGKELAPNGTCVPCRIGTYRTAGVHRLCESCPVNLTTSGIGSTQSSQCNLIACPAGYKRIGSDTGVCEPCPIGTYQNQPLQTDCISCGGARYRTDNVASTRQDQCKFFCESGYEVVNGTCQICEFGKYKDNNDDPYGRCRPCGGVFRTNRTGSTSASECVVVVCGEGEKPNAANNGCMDCPPGTYQPQREQKDCIPCPNGTNTRQPAATSDLQCEPYCEPGYGKEGNGCVGCRIGYYRGGFTFDDPCEKCPDDYVTSSTLQTNQLQCTIRACPVGTKRKSDESGCDDCPRGTYQNVTYQNFCEQCPGNTYTRNNRSTSENDCERYCNSGEEIINGVCVKCAVGYYKDNNIDVFHTCTMCDPDFITPGNGSTSENSCTLANCTAGYKRDSNLTSCVPCPRGYYQDKKWQNDCTQCPQHKTTALEGADRLSLCILSCDPGYEDVNGTCRECRRGYYKTQKAAEACTSCPTNTTTTGIGSTARNDCNETYCYPGTYLERSSNLCRTCPYDKFQPDSLQYACNDCTNGRVTLVEGATSADQCVLDCPSGQAYDIPSASCQICQQGYYRDKTDRDQTTCQICTNGNTTPGNGSTSSADCTIANCTTPGQYRDPRDNSCKACPVGTYNSRKWQDSCTPCLNGFTTELSGSATVDDCRRDCASGYQVDSNDICQPCPRGSYRNKTTSWTCVQCENGLSTQTDASTSAADCNISPCVAGQRFILGEKRCEACPNGYYQPQPAQFGCIRCPNGRYTNGTGTMLESDCLSFCTTNRHNCHIDARCSENVDTGFTCTCMDGFVGNGSHCIHKCDQGYCVNGDCIRLPAISCVCPDGYQGDRCEVRQDAERQSQQINRTIIIASVSVAAFIMIIIILVVCCIVMQKRRRDKMREPIDYNGPVPEKTSLYTRMSTMPYDSYTHGHSRSPSPGGTFRYGMAPMGEIGMYDNQAYSGSRDPAVYEA